MQFCGRTEDEVGFLITGMNGYICDSCATQAYEITQRLWGWQEGKCHEAESERTS